MLSILTNHYQFILSGVGTTLLLLVITLILGLILSLIFASVKFYNIPVFTQIINGIVFIVRGTPFLVQLFIIYYGPLQFSWLSHSLLGVPFKSATFCALLGLTLNTTAYTSSLFYGAMKNLPKGEIIAAKAIGLGRLHTLAHIIIPRFFARIFPVYINEVIMVLKCTALVSTITILDTMGVLQQLMTQTYQTLPCLYIAGGIYVFLTVLLTLALKWFNRKYFTS
jgi:His/Glu/Gln/Arg/opine family amino acid ABC transporter permease subunit